MKFCKDCKYCAPAQMDSDVNRWGFAECLSPKNVKTHNRVTGAIQPRYTFASTQRSGDWIDAYFTSSCGPQARWFKRKSEDAKPE